MHRLVVRVGMNGGREAPPDAERVVEHLRGRRQAVGRARGVRDDAVAGRVVRVLVDAEHEGHVRILGGGGDDHLLRAGLEMLGRGRGVPEEARRLDDDLDSELLPRQRRGILHRAYPDLAPVDEDGFSLRDDLGAERAVDRIVLQQVRERLRGREIVDSDHLDLGRPEGRAEEDAPDPTEPVHADSNRHGGNSLLDRSEDYMTVHVARATQGTPARPPPRTALRARRDRTPTPHGRARAPSAPEDTASPRRRRGRDDPDRTETGSAGAADAERSGADGRRTATGPTGAPARAGPLAGYGRRVFHRPHPAHRSCHMGAATPHAEQRCGTPNAWASWSPRRYSSKASRVWPRRSKIAPRNACTTGRSGARTSIFSK